MNIYKKNDKINYNNEQYTVRSSIVYLNENYVIANTGDRIETTIILKKEKENFIPVNYPGNEELYHRLLVLFIGI